LVPQNYDSDFILISIFAKFWKTVFRKIQFLETAWKMKSLSYFEPPKSNPYLGDVNPLIQTPPSSHIWTLTNPNPYKHLIAAKTPDVIRHPKKPALEIELASMPPEARTKLLQMQSQLTKVGEGKGNVWIYVCVVWCVYVCVWCGMCMWCVCVCVRAHVRERERERESVCVIESASVCVIYLVRCDLLSSIVLRTSFVVCELTVACDMFVVFLGKKSSFCCEKRENKQTRLDNILIFIFYFVQIRVSWEFNCVSLWIQLCFFVQAFCYFCAPAGN
jgi:hypothetical protein